jgi:hypothetical protein
MLYQLLAMVLQLRDRNTGLVEIHGVLIGENTDSLECRCTQTTSESKWIAQLLSQATNQTWIMQAHPPPDYLTDY